MIIECYQLLKEIEKRPAMWTGEVNLKSIKLFVSGYYQALIDNKIVPENIDEPFLIGLQISWAILSRLQDGQI